MKCCFQQTATRAENGLAAFMLPVIEQTTTTLLAPPCANGDERDSDPFADLDDEKEVI